MHESASTPCSASHASTLPNICGRSAYPQNRAPSWRPWGRSSRGAVTRSTHAVGDDRGTPVQVRSPLDHRFGTDLVQDLAAARPLTLVEAVDVIEESARDAEVRHPEHIGTPVD